MIGGHHRRQKATPFCELEPQIRALFEHQKRRDLELERKAVKDLVQEELNASAFRELEGSMAMENQLNAQKWSRLQSSRLNESAKKESEAASSPKASSALPNSVAGFKPEVFRTPVIKEKIKSQHQIHNVTPIIQQVQKTLLHKTDSVIKTDEKFVAGSDFDFKTSTPAGGGGKGLPDISFRPSIIPPDAKTKPDFSSGAIFKQKTDEECTPVKANQHSVSFATPPISKPPQQPSTPTFHTPPSEPAAQSRPFFQTLPTSTAFAQPSQPAAPAAPPSLFGQPSSTGFAPATSGFAQPSQAAAPVSAAQPIPQAPPPKFDPKVLEQFQSWITSLTNEHKTLRGKLSKYRKEPANAKFCATLKRVINERIDVTTSKDYNDVQRLSSIHVFFTHLLTFQPVRGSEPDSEVQLNQGDEVAMEYTMAWICERYMKLVATDADLTETVATIFAMLVKQVPRIRDRLLSLVVSSSTLIKMNVKEIATKCDELAAQPVEESTNWLPEEANKVRLLLKVCFYSKEVQSNNVPGLFLLETLVQSATQAPPIPISTCFVLNLAIQTASKHLKASPQFETYLNTTRYLVGMDWTSQLNTVKTSLKHPQAGNALESRHNACLQQLKSTLTNW